MRSNVKWQIIMEHSLGLQLHKPLQLSLAIYRDSTCKSLLKNRQVAMCIYQELFILYNKGHACSFSRYNSCQFQAFNNDSGAERICQWYITVKGDTCKDNECQNLHNYMLLFTIGWNISISPSNIYPSICLYISTSQHAC